MALKARFWNSFAAINRINDAAGRPFRSLHIASGDNGSSAITALQNALKRIEDRSVFLVIPFFPDTDVDGFRFGPYDINASERNDAGFGTTTERAVIKYQKQAGRLEVDGKAGMNTLTRIDEMLKFLQAIDDTPPSPFEF